VPSRRDFIPKKDISGRFLGKQRITLSGVILPANHGPKSVIPRQKLFLGFPGLDRKTVIVIPVGVRITAAGSRFGAARWTTLVLGCAPNHGSSPESRFRWRRITVSLERITVSITVFWWAGEHFSRACASGVRLPPPHRRTRTKNPTTRPSCITVREALICVFWKV
jgi:hypothetical protein